MPDADKCRRRSLHHHQQSKPAMMAALGTITPTHTCHFIEGWYMQVGASSPIRFHR